MKKNLLFVFFVGYLSAISLWSNAQVVISKDPADPDPSAMIDIISDNKGLLLPRVHLISLHSPNPILNPAKGLIVFNIEMSNPALQTVVSGLFMWDGVIWRQLSLPRGTGLHDLLVWNGHQYVTFSAGLPGQYLMVSSDSTLVWSNITGISHSPTIVTSSPSDISQFQFKIGGNVVSDGGSAVTQRGICYSINPNPDYFSSRISGGYGIGLFTISLTGLNANTLYYVKAFAINAYDTVYGDQITVQTLPVSIPSVETLDPANVSQNSVTISGNVVSDGGSFIYFRGICYDTIPNPTLEDSKTTEGSGAGQFTSNITGLLVGKTYYFRAYAWNSKGVGYGVQKQATTSCSNSPAASITVSTPQTTICEGTSVTLTASAVNAGTNPAFIWILNGENVGSNGPAYTFAPSNGDQIGCILVSDLFCVTNSPDTSNIITFTVNPMLNPGISIIPSATTVCSGTPVTLMATPVNGGISPGYQWKVNGIPAGGNNSVYSYTPANHDSVVCVLSSSANCINNSQAVSNSVIITVKTQLEVSVNISTPLTTVCPGTNITFTANTTNGGLNPVFQWQVNEINVGPDSPSFSYVPQNNDQVRCIVTSDESCTTVNQVTSNVVPLTVITPVLPSILISSSANNICAGASVVFTANPVNPGTNIQYQWKVNGLPVGANSPNFSYNPANSDSVTCALTSTVQCLSQITVQSNKLIMGVNPVVPATVSITPTTNPVCSQTNVTFVATPVNGGTSPGYQWRVNGQTVGQNLPVFTYMPVENDNISCTMASSQTCAAPNPALSNTVVMNVVQPVPVSVSIVASSNTVCSGTLVTFSSTVLNGGASPVYQWYRNGLPFGGNTPSISLVPASNDSIKCKVTSAETCVSSNPAMSNTLSVSVTPLVPVSVSVVADANPVCAQTPVTFTAVVTNGGTNPSFQWQVNGNNIGNNTPGFTYTPANMDVVKCIVTSGLVCANNNPATSNQVNMQVNSYLPVGVTISSSANGVCNGTPVTFMATAINGGSNPSYIWKVNGIAQAGNGNQFSYVPVNNDKVSCALTSSATCATGNPALSDTITMNVISTAVAAVNIAASANPVCSGSQVTFSATISNGGTLPVLQWKVNEIAVGSNMAVFSYTPLQGDQVSCLLTSNANCVANSPVNSNTIPMTVNPLMPVSATVTADANPVCAQTPVNYSATVINGGTNPVYQWQVNGNNIGNNTPGFTYTPANMDVVKCIVTSDLVCANNNPATSNQVNMQVLPLMPVAVTITASGNPVCSGTQVVYTAVHENGGQNPSYTWYVNGTPQGVTGNVFSYIPAQDDQIMCELFANSNCPTGNPALSNIIEMDVTPTVNPTITIASSHSNICAGTPVTFTASATNGGSTPQYIWKVNGIATGANTVTYIYTPQDQDVVTCELISSAICIAPPAVISNSIGVTVNPLLPVAVSLAVSQNPVCAGTLVSVIATPQNGGSNPVYQWYLNGSPDGNTSGPVYQFIPQPNDQISCKLTSSENCTTGNPATTPAIIMQINNVAPVSVSIAASSNPVCENTPVTFAATTVNGGTNPVYQWKVNGIAQGSSNVQFTYTPVSGDLITCELTSSENCATGNPAISNSVTMQVNPMISAQISISASDNPVCQGTLVHFTAIAVNEGSNPVFQWKINGNNAGTNNSTFSYVPANLDVITCELISSLPCAPVQAVVSNAVTMNVSPLLPVSITILASVNPVCSGTMVTFSSVTGNAGVSPTYQWYVNGVIDSVAAGPQYQYYPQNNDVIICKLISGNVCSSGNPAISNAIIMEVTNSLASDINITTSANPVCAGTMVTYSANFENGGTSPAFQWLINDLFQGSNSSSFSYVPANGDKISCILTSNASCAVNNPDTSNSIIMIVNPVFPVATAITASVNPVCAQTEVNYTATVTNGGSMPAYQWQVNGNIVGNGTSEFSYIPVNSDVVRCFVTSDLSCVSNNPAQSNQINMQVMEVLPVSVTINASSNPICEGTSVMLSAMPVNGGSNPVYEWRVNGTSSGSNNNQYTFVPENNDQVSCIMTSSANCTTGNPATSDTISFEVLPQNILTVNIIASQNPVCANTMITMTASVTNGGASPVYLWKVNGNPAGSNQSTYSFIPNNGDVVTCTVTSGLLCVQNNNIVSNPVAITVTQPVQASLTIVASQLSVCEGTVVNFTANPVNAGSNPVYQWKVNGYSVGENLPSYSYSPNNNDVITCVMSSGLSCLQQNPVISNTLTVAVAPKLAVGVQISASANNICAGTMVNFNATITNGGTNPVLNWLINGVSIGASGTGYSYIPNNGDRVACTVVSNYACAIAPTVTSDTILMTVNPVMPASVTITTSSTTVCAGTSVTFNASPVNGGTAPVYVWKVNGIVVGANSPVFSYLPVNNDVINCVMTSNEICPGNATTTSNSLIMNVLPVMPVSLSITSSSNTVCAGTPVAFSANAINAGTMPLYDWKVNGISSGINSPNFAYAPVNGDNVLCILTSSVQCATGSPSASNTISITVNQPVPVSVSVTSDFNSVCAGSQVTCTAQIVNGGTAPGYQWLVNDIPVGANSPLFSYIPADNDRIVCRATSNASCVSGNPAFSAPKYIKVNPILAVSVTASPSANPVCAGSAVSFTASPVNQGPNPVYQWFVNNIPAGPNGPVYSYIPGNGDKIKCLLTSDALCTTGNPASSNIVNMEVYTMLYVGTIAGSQVVCSNTQPNLLVATPPSNGYAPSFQWQKSYDNINFENITGATSISYLPQVILDSVYYRQLQNASGTCGGPLPTNVVVVSAIPPLPVEVSIIMNTAGIIYQGASVSFSAFASNGGNNPVYQWFVNGVASGTNQSTFTYIPSNDDAVYCVMSSDLSCVSGNPASSNTIIVPVSSDPLLPVAVSISSTPSGPVCQGSTVVFSAVPGNGGTNPQYQWKVNGVSTGPNESVFNYVPANGDVISCTLTSSLPNAIGNPAVSNQISVVVNPLLPVSITVTASGNPVCEGTSVTYMASAQNGGSSPVYQWKVNGVVHGPNSPVFTYTPANNDQITCSLESSETCVNNPLAVSIPITMQVTPLHVVSVTVVPSANPVCAGSPVLFTATPVNGGSNPQYQWKVNGISQGSNLNEFSYTPLNNDQVLCVLTSNLVCAVNNPAVSNTVTMTVNNASTVEVTISTSLTTVCDGTNVLLVATPVNGGSAPVYQWMVNGQNAGTNSSSFSFIPADLDEVTCVLNSNALCATGNPATSNSKQFTVNPLNPVSVSVSPSANPVCAATSVTFTAVAVNPGMTPTYQWKVNNVVAGTNNTSFTYTPANEDNVTCSLTSSATCATGNPATSNIVHMAVNPTLTMSATIVASANNICAGTPVTYTCNAVNAGPSPVYQWKVNNIIVSTDTNFYTYAPSNSDQVKCTVLASGQCLTNVGNKVNSNIITMKVNPLVPVTITVSPSANNVCIGTTVTFTATFTNGGTLPVFQWKVNGQIVGTNQPTYSYVPQNLDQVTCSLTSNVACPSVAEATSAPVIIVVNPQVQVSLSIEPSANPSCAGSPVSFTAIPVNGGSAPVFQWKVNDDNVGNGSSSFSYIPSHGDHISCTLTSSANCAIGNPAPSNIVDMSVSPLVETSVSITESANNTCTGTQINFTATPVNGGSAPLYQWTVNNENVGTNSPSFAYFPANNDSVKCLMTSSLACPSFSPASSNTIHMVMSSSPVTTISIASSATTVCNGTTVECTATGLNTGTAPVYQWVLNGTNVGTNSPSYSFTPVAGASLKCVLTSSLLCVSGNPDTSNTINFTVNPVVQASIGVVASPSGAVCQSSTVVFTANPVNGGTTPGYQWKLNGANIAGATGSSYSYAPTNGNVISCVMTSNAPCVSGSPATSNSLTMTVNPSTPVSVNIWASKYAVMPSTPVTYYAKPVNGGSAPSYTWFLNDVQVASGASSYTYNPSNNDNIKCVLSSSLPGCLSGNPATSNIINMIVYTTGTACAGTPTVLYGGKTYNTVQIGTQCWFRENLNIGTMINSSGAQTNNSTIEKYCYVNDSTYCNVYGGLYQWAEMVQYLNGVTNTTHWNPLPTGNVQGICPAGWHIPSQTESNTLTTYLGSTAGGRMKEAGYVHWNSPNTGANNNVGFTALPAGHLYGGNFGNLRQYINIWTTTKGTLVDAAIVFGAAYNASMYSINETLKTTGYSVRCVKN